MLNKLWINLMVSDVNRTIDFYVDVLEFHHVMSVAMGSEQVLFDYTKDSQPLVYALLKHNDVEIMLQERQSLMKNVPAFSEDEDIRSSAVLYFDVYDVDGLAENLKKHCSIVRDLHDTFYGMREIYVKDPNGYILGFAQQKKA